METAKSADGTAIAYECAGDGPPLVVSVGAFCTRQTFVAPEDLRQRFTVVTYDRRGRGDSGDIQPFAPEREYEDLAAVAARRGWPAAGRDCRLRGAIHRRGHATASHRPGGPYPRAGQLRPEGRSGYFLDVGGRPAAR